MKRVARDIKASMGIYESEGGTTFGLLAEFANPGALLHAAEAVRKAGYRHFDTHSPFPVHGMDRAMGLGNSQVGYFALVGGVTGAAVGYVMQWWMNGIDYPLNISGKPFFAIEPSVPIIFELTILLAAIGAVAGMFGLNGLPRPYNPLFYSETFRRASDDGFFLHIASSDRRFDLHDTNGFLVKVGALHVEEIFDHGIIETSQAEDEQ
ncbi:MAG: DUF3341 domain-containing protein [Rhodothermales bacterium]